MSDYQSNLIAVIQVINKQVSLPMSAQVCVRGAGRRLSASHVFFPVLYSTGTARVSMPSTFEGCGPARHTIQRGRSSLPTLLQSAASFTPEDEHFLSAFSRQVSPQLPTYPWAPTTLVIVLERVPQFRCSVLRATAIGAQSPPTI